MISVTTQPHIQTALHSPTLSMLEHWCMAVSALHWGAYAYPTGGDTDTYTCSRPHPTIYHIQYCTHTHTQPQTESHTHRASDSLQCLAVCVCEYVCVYLCVCMCVCVVCF